MSGNAPSVDKGPKQQLRIPDMNAGAKAEVSTSDVHSVYIKRETSAAAP